MEHWSRWCGEFANEVLKYEDRPDKDRWQDVNVARLEWAFTTRDGSWDVSETPGSITPEARARWLVPPTHPEYNAQGGGDHNIFGAVLGKDGKLIGGKGFYWWSSGIDKLALPSDVFYQDPSLTGRAAEGSGWANIPITGFYDPKLGPGPWAYAPIGKADVFYGMAMPYNWHVSTFGVWQLYDAGTDPGPGGGGGTDPAQLAELIAEVRRVAESGERVAAAFEKLLVKIWPDA